MMFTRKALFKELDLSYLVDASVMLNIYADEDKPTSADITLNFNPGHDPHDGLAEALRRLADYFERLFDDVSTPILLLPVDDPTSPDAPGLGGDRRKP